MSLFWTVALLQFKVPSATCRQDQLLGSHEWTYSMSWSELGPPNSILAPPPVGGAPAREPLICDRWISMYDRSWSLGYLTWIFRSFTPLQVSHVPSTAVVCPVPLNIGPLTTSIALSSPVGYPAVLISWSGDAKSSGASIRYCWLGHRLKTYPVPEEFRRVFRRSVSVSAGLGSWQFEVSWRERNLE